MKLVQLIERGDIKMHVINHIAGVYTLLLSSGDTSVVTLFPYMGHPANVTIPMVLGIRLIHAYNYDHLTQQAWEAKYKLLPNTIAAETNYEKAREDAREIRNLLGPLYDEYIQILKDDNIINLYIKEEN